MSASFPSLSHSVSRDLVNGNKTIKFDFLALSMILTRSQQDYKKRWYRKIAFLSRGVLFFF
jgi:hypothetical protein